MYLLPRSEIGRGAHHINHNPFHGGPDIVFLKCSKDLFAKLYLQLNLTQIVYSNSKMLFL